MSGDKKRKLPEGWKWETLDNITTNIQYGISKSSTSNKVGPRLLRITDIQDGKVDWNKVPFCECNSNEEKQYLLENNDIVFVRTGATTGKSFLLNNPENTLFASYLIRVQCNKELVNPKYLYTFFQTPIYWNHINQKSRGGTLAGFNASMLSNIEIPLPPTLTDQLAIAADLERRMAHVEKMRGAALRQKEAIAAMQGAVLREVFSYKEGDELPEGWKWFKLKQLGSLSQGGTPSTEVLEYWNGNFPFITGADVTELYVSNARSFLTEKGLDSGKTQKCEKGDLLIVSRTRVGRIGIAAITLGVSQDVSVLKMNRSYDAKYLAVFLNSISKRLEEACQGATIKGLTRDYIENISITIPPTHADQIAIASELERKMSELEKARRATKRQLEAIEALPGAILREVFDFEEENTGS